MQTFTTNGAIELIYADDFRNNGCPDFRVLLKESSKLSVDPCKSTRAVYKKQIENSKKIFVLKSTFLIPK